MSSNSNKLKMRMRKMTKEMYVSDTMCLEIKIFSDDTD